MNEQVKSLKTAVVTLLLRRKSNFIALEFILSLIGVGIATVLIVQQIFAFIILMTFNNGTIYAADVFRSSVPNFVGTSGLPSTVGTALFAIVTAALPVFLFPRVKRALRDQPNFTQGLAYKLSLNVLFGAVVIAALYFASQLVATAVSSLLLTGVTTTNIGDLYIQQFIPTLCTLLFLGVIGVLLRSLLRGKDTTKSLSWTVLGAAVTLALAVTIPTTIQVHELNITYPGPGPINCPECGGLQPLDLKNNSLRR